MVAYCCLQTLGHPHLYLDIWSIFEMQACPERNPGSICKAHSAWSFTLRHASVPSPAVPTESSIWYQISTHAVHNEAMFFPPAWFSSIFSSLSSREPYLQLRPLLSRAFANAALNCQSLFYWRPQPLDKLLYWSYSSIRIETPWRRTFVCIDFFCLVWVRVSMSSRLHFCYIMVVPSSFCLPKSPTCETIYCDSIVMKPNKVSTPQFYL